MLWLRFMTTTGKTSSFHQIFRYWLKKTHGEKLLIIHLPFMVNTGPAKRTSPEIQCCCYKLSPCIPGHASDSLSMPLVFKYTAWQLRGHFFHKYTKTTPQNPVVCMQIASPKFHPNRIVRGVNFYPNRSIKFSQKWTKEWLHMEISPEKSGSKWKKLYPPSLPPFQINCKYDDHDFITVTS